jgi:hypothetical protein
MIVDQNIIMNSEPFKEIKKVHDWIHGKEEE